MVIALYLKRPDSETETAIFARIRYAGQEMKYYLPEKINPKYWNKETQRAKATSKFPEYPEFNTVLDNYIAAIKNVYRSYINNNSNQLPELVLFKQLLDRDLKQISTKVYTFLSFYEEIIELSKKGVRLHNKKGTPITPNTIKCYVTTYRHLQDYSSVKNKQLSFDNITLEFYHDYLEFLQGKYTLSNNAIGKDIKNIKMVMGEALERGLTKNLSYQGKLFNTVKEETSTIYLNDSELKAMEALDLSQNRRLETIRDLFLIASYTGLRFSDYKGLTAVKSDSDTLEVTQTKTGDRIIIPIHPVVRRVMTKYHYNLPRLISNQKTNEYLKQIGKLCPVLQTRIDKNFTKGGVRLSKSLKKWELLTTHTARRSFATNEYIAGMPTITIMAITGHKSEKSFMRYLKVTPDEHARIMLKAWQDRGEFVRIAN